MKWRNTYNKLNIVGDILIKGLQDTLRFQKHNATGKLSNSFKKNRRRNALTLNVITNRKYWKIVNNGKSAFKPNLEEIYRWVVAKGIKGSGSSKNPSAMQQRGIALRIAKNIARKGIPSKPYVVWTEANFAGVTKEKKHNQVVNQIQGGLVSDVVRMIKDSIRTNAPNAKTI